VAIDNYLVLIMIDHVSAEAKVVAPVKTNQNL
jgi:hypothetical protein